MGAARLAEAKLPGAPSLLREGVEKGGGRVLSPLCVLLSNNLPQVRGVGGGFSR